MKRAVCVSALACLPLLAAPVLASGVRAEGRENAPGQLLEVQLLGFNDYHGQPSVESLNAMGLDVSGVG
ncbi:MAG: hypothetical protein ACNA8G_12695, partial [Gammaproteobacteria bacterium]